MAELTETIDIARRRDQVWAALADFEAISSWASDVDHSSMVTGTASGAGATRRVQIGRNTLLERVVDWAPGHTLSYEVEGLPPVVRSVRNTWRLHDTGDTTTATLTTTVDAGPRRIQQAVARIIATGIARTLRQLLTDVKHHLEETPS